MKKKKRNRTTILWVDDSIYLRVSNVERIRDEGYEVLEADDADQALKILSEEGEKISLAVLDIMMEPGEAFSAEETRAGYLTGLALARVIRRKYPHIRLLGYSHLPDPTARDWFEKYGEGFFTWYIDPKEEMSLKVIKKIELKVSSKRKLPKVLIIHGDEQIKLELKDYLQNELKLDEPIILHERFRDRQTFIENFEHRVQQPYLIFILIPTEVKGKAKRNDSDKRKGLQNVLFEAGFFHAKLQQRKGKILFLYSGELKLPSDIAGISYIDITGGVRAAGEKIRKEIKRWI